MRFVKNGMFAFLVLMMMSLTVWAEMPVPEDGDCSALLYQAGSFAMPEVTAAGVNKIDVAKSILLKGLRNGEELIDFTGSGVYYYRDIWDAYPEVINENPDLFYVTGGYRLVEYEYDGELDDFVALTLEVAYDVPASEVKQVRAAYQAELGRITSYASSAKTPLMKALMVNDYFCVNYQYDLSFTYYDAYSLFTKKTGVCNAYMLGYKAAMQALGIPVKSVISQEMNHAWNMVQIDGAWYHVDVTWNDPVADRVGRARHCYFMRSDAGFMDNAYASPHYSWAAEDGVRATSDRFDDAPWCTLDVPAVVAGDSYYLIRGHENGEIVAVSGVQQNTVQTFTTKWKITGGENDGRFRPACYSALGYYRDHLVYTLYDKVLAYSLKDGSVKTLFTAPKGVGIWLALFDGNVLHYSLGQDYNIITESDDLILNFGGVTPIGDLLVIPRQTTVVQAEAFRGAKVRNVVGGEELQRIETLAFAYCTDLETVELGENVSYIADDAFKGCKNVTFISPAESYAANYAAAHGFAMDNT